MEIVEGGYEEPAPESMLNENQQNTLKNLRKKDKKVLFFIYQVVDRGMKRFQMPKSSKHA